MTALDDKLFLEGLAEYVRGLGVSADESGGVLDADRIEKIAGRIKNPPVEVVEQTTLGRKSPAIPDGWSWTDIGPFTGKFSGIRLQKGEPVVEQKGHLLLIRLGDNLTQRQLPIYERASALLGVTVLVVYGGHGARRGLLPFVDGKQMGLRTVEGPEEVTGWIVRWLETAWSNPLAEVPKPQRPPRQERLA